MDSHPIPTGLNEFLPLLRQEFTLHTNAGPFALRLTEVSPLPASGAPQCRTEPFQLLFHLPGFQYPPQGTYRLTAEAGFDQPIFLVPVGQDPLGILYQAVFN